MFYLTKKKIGEIKEGDECIVLADFSGIPAGMRGTIRENYKVGVMVEWHKKHEAYQPPYQDGFGDDELHYLAFATEKCPERFDEEDFAQVVKNKDVAIVLEYIKTHA